MSNLLVRLLGSSATLIHGDPTVLDRWFFLKRRLPKARLTGERILEVGCGTGAFTIGVAKRGYEAVGLSWDERNQTVAQQRAEISGVKNVSFPIGDARKLDEYTEFVDTFDAIVCFEVIEHILDDRKLFKDIFSCLKPGGRLYMTTPNYNYRPLETAEMGPFSTDEDGWHVRRGYSPSMLRELCELTEFEVEEITYVSGFFSQVIALWQKKITPVFGDKIVWLIIFPLRILPKLLDGWLGKILGNMFGWPGYSIALVAYKKRFASNAVPMNIEIKRKQ